MTMLPAFSRLAAGGVAALLVSGSAASSQTPPVAPAAAPPPPACGPEFREFDFWVGKWEVFGKRRPDRKVADSLIEKLYNGCAIRENWMPLGRTGGGSLSTYIPATGKWRQFWVDSGGSAVDFVGGWNGHAMVIEGVWPSPGHPTQITRMTYTALPDGSVEQLGETSDDEGKTWQPGFDFIYRRAAS